MLSSVANIFLGCLVAALLFTADASLRRTKNRNVSGSSRIVDGVAIPIENAPYMVQIWEGGAPTCGGTLISLQHVLTAAHCINQTNLQETRVVAGVTLISEVGPWRHIDTAVVHPKFSLKPVYYDVAVIKLVEPFTKGDKIKPLEKLSTSAPAAGVILKASGWGSTRRVNSTDETTAKDYRDELYQVRLPIISDADCRRRLRVSRRRKTDSRICTLGDGVDVCGGDSGGPGVCGDELCGVVSWGIGCANGWPAVFTAVHAVRDFINEKLLI